MKKLLLSVALSTTFATGTFAADAAENWKAKCKSCHGDTGKGDTKVGQKEKVEDLSTAEFQSKHTDADIKQVIAEGSTENKKMKPFKEKLTPEEIDALVKHVRAFKK
ncbi:MAG: c-type cytochrome [Myxococcaceae bacterium]